jgi:hypothetical protein
MVETYKISIIHIHTYIDYFVVIILKKVSSKRCRYGDMNTGAHNFTFLSCAKGTPVGHNDVRIHFTRTKTLLVESYSEDSYVIFSRLCCVKASRRVASAGTLPDTVSCIGLLAI